MAILGYFVIILALIINELADRDWPTVSRTFLGIGIVLCVVAGVVQIVHYGTRWNLLRSDTTVVLGVLLLISAGLMQIDMLVLDCADNRWPRASLRLRRLSYRLRLVSTDV